MSEKGFNVVIAEARQPYECTRVRKIANRLSLSLILSFVGSNEEEDEDKVPIRK